MGIFPAEAYEAEDCGFVVFSMAGGIADGCFACWISDVNKFTCAGETEASSGHRENGIASAEKFCKSTPGMSMSK
ncbi:MAG: hypothetical protein J6T06_17805 [Victivallales bacterium]|nr:hypothetical protein [Victivallales bacterium]